MSAIAKVDFYFILFFLAATKLETTFKLWFQKSLEGQNEIPFPTFEICEEN